MDIKYSVVSVNSVEPCVTNEQDMEKVPKKGCRVFIYVAACTVNIACFACGAAFGWASPELPKLSGKVDPSDNPLSIPANANDESWIASLICIGGAFGPFTVGLFMDNIGRKLTILFSTIPILISSIMFAYANNVYYFYLGRFLTGLSTGSIITVVPFYITEIAEVDIRGKLGMFMQIFLILGSLSSSAIAPTLSVHTFNLICITPILVFVLLFFFCPESPHYLVMIGDDEGAEKALKKLRIKSDQEIHNELMDIKWILEKSTRNRGSLKKLFAEKAALRAFLLSLALVVFQQASGIAAIAFYTQDIFTSAGGSIPPQYYAVIMTSVQLISGLLAPLFIEKSGKKVLLYISYIGCSISLLFLGYYFHVLKGSGDIKSISWLPLTAFVGFNLSFTIGIGPVPWTLISEYLPSNIKGIAASIVACMGSMTTFFVVKLFVDFTPIIGISGCFWFFSGVCILSFVFTWVFVPETTGKTLQEIQDLLKGGKPKDSIRI